MPRIKIDLPEKFNFSTLIDIRINDINYGGHLGNDAVLSIAHEARIRYLDHLGGYTELDIEGASVIMADVAIVYRSEGFHGDQVKIEVTAGDFSSSGFDIYYKFMNQTTGKELAILKTGMVCFDYENRKVIPVPEKFKELTGS